MKELSQMTSDQILMLVQKRSEQLYAAEISAAEAKTNLDGFEAASIIAHRDAGCSVAEAERRMRLTESWKEVYQETQERHLEAAKLKRDYQRALLAADLWRTEQSTLRKIS